MPLDEKVRFGGMGASIRRCEERKMSAGEVVLLLDFGTWVIRGELVPRFSPLFLPH